MKTFLPIICVLSLAIASPSYAQPTPNLIPNGDFELDKDGDAWPDDWGKFDHGASYETENGNHFLRFSYTKPDDAIVGYRVVAIPAETGALELSFKARTTGLQPGAQPWFDARIMMNFKDGAGNKLEPGPGDPYFRDSTKEWTTHTQKFLVPPGATQLEFMPGLVQVKAGTFDLDGIVLKPVDAEVLKKEAAQAEAQRIYLNLAPEAARPEKWPSELKTEGTQILNQEGRPVRLQGVNVVSLEWSAEGENVLRAAEVAVDDWKSNLIRLPVNSEFWFGKGADDGGKAYRKLVNDVINVIANRGAYVLLDLHHFGAPRSLDADFWKDAATVYKNHPAVLFDLFNEPHDTTWAVWRDGGFVPDKDAPADEDNFLSPAEKALNAKGFHAIGMQKLVDTVRATGAKNIIVAGGLDWAYDLSGIDNGYALDDKGGHGLVYSTHIYPWKKDWEGAIGVAMTKHPILVGEVGASNHKMDWLPADQQEDAATWVPKMLAFIEKNKLNWTAFSFHPTAMPNLITGWGFEGTPEWGVAVKGVLGGK